MRRSIPNRVDDIRVSAALHYEACTQRLARVRSACLTSVADWWRDGWVFAIVIGLPVLVLYCVLYYLATVNLNP